MSMYENQRNSGNQRYQNQSSRNQRGRNNSNSRYQNQRRGNFTNRNFRNRNGSSYDNRQSRNNDSDGDNDDSGYDNNDTNEYDKDEENDEEEENDDENDDEEEEDEDDDDDDEEEDDDNEYERLKEGDDENHSAAPDKDVLDKIKKIDFTPVKSSIDPNFRSKEVYPFIDAFIMAYNDNSSFLPEFYTEDAVFSLTFKKMPRNSEVSALFEDNRNMKFHPKIPPVSGGQNILDFLKTKFGRGSELEATDKHVQFVSRLLFAVNIKGTINLYKTDGEMKTVKCVKTLVVIGRGGKLLIANDHLAICM